jgi:hypothetical protein
VSASANLPKTFGKASKADPPANPAQPMTRDQALRTLGLATGASDSEIDEALAKEKKRRQTGLNGSDHAIAAKVDAAREILRGKDT